MVTFWQKCIFCWSKSNEILRKVIKVAFKSRGAPLFLFCKFAPVGLVFRDRNARSIKLQKAHVFLAQWLWSLFANFVFFCRQSLMNLPRNVIKVAFKSRGTPLFSFCKFAPVGLVFRDRNARSIKSQRAPVFLAHWLHLFTWALVKFVKRAYNFCTQSYASELRTHHRLSAMILKRMCCILPRKHQANL